MRIAISYTLAAALVLGGLWVSLRLPEEPATYYLFLYFGAFLGISIAACSEPFSKLPSLADTFVELVETSSVPIRWLMIVGGAIGWVFLVLFLPLIGALIIELARRVFLPTVNMTINDWLWLLSAIINGSIAALAFWPLRALFAMRASKH